ncbi:hypothetical protein [Roseiflexus sp.]|uniref:hypothetical protein n=1 Tax=Roseiflexus sp. TaxID=2562120 RepID=UPI00398B38DF
MRVSHSSSVLMTVGAIGLAATCLTGGLIAVGETLFALAPATLGGMWVAGVILQRRWTRVVALPGMVVVAVGATFAQVAPVVALVGLVMTLFAWNLDDLERRLIPADRVIDEQTLRRAHAVRLLSVSGLAFVIGVLASVARVEIGTIGALLLGALAVLGLSRIVTLLRRMAQDDHQ